MAIVLHQVPGAWGTPSVSPFCTKLQAWFRMAGIAHRVVDANMLISPRGKVPFVEADGAILCDSQLIVERYAKEHPELDDWLTDDQRALGQLVRRTLEEATYWHLVYARWVEEPAFTEYRKVFAAMMPYGTKTVGPLFIQSGIKKKLHGQGTGRRTPDEVHRMGIEDVDALARVLGDKPFLHGERPCTVDATVFAFVDGLLAFPVRSPVHQATWDRPNLVAYANRVRARWFPELSPWGSAPAPAARP